MLAMLTLVATAIAASPQALYERGLDHAREGRHEAAADAFVESLDAGGRDPAVYHGLGNALWRLGHAGPATAAWRRGLRLAPRDGDIAANLDRARKALADHLAPPESSADLFFWQSMLSPRDSGLLASLLWMLALSAPLLRRLRSMERRVGAESGILLLVGVLVAISTRAAVVSEASVVVVADEVSARSALGPEGVELFVLHEGAEVQLIESHHSHHLVALPDERKGWVPADTTLSTDPSRPFPKLSLVTGAPSDG